MTSKLIPWIAGGLSGLVLGVVGVSTALKQNTPQAPPPIVVNMPSVVNLPSVPTIQNQQIDSPDEYVGIPQGAQRKLQQGKALFNRRETKQSDAVFKGLLKEYEAYPLVASESLYYLAATAYRQREPARWEKALSNLERIADEYPETPAFHDGRLPELVTQAILWILRYSDDRVEGERITSKPHYDLALKHLAFFNRLRISPDQRRRVTVAFEGVQNHQSFVLPDELSYNTPLMYPDGGGLDIKSYFFRWYGNLFSPEGTGSVVKPAGGLMQAPYDPKTWLCYTLTAAKPDWIADLVLDQLGLTVSHHRASALARFYSGIIIHDCGNKDRVLSYYAARTEDTPSSMPVRQLFGMLQLSAVGTSTEMH